MSDLTDFRISNHALDQMITRDIDLEVLNSIIKTPEQIVHKSNGRDIYQTRIETEENRVFLYHVVLDVWTEPPTIVTIYRASKVTKYWSER